MSTKSRVPNSCLQKPSGRAYMRIRGCVRHLRPRSSIESREEYGRRGARIGCLTGGRTGVELVAAYLNFGETYRRKGGMPAHTVDDVGRAVALLKVCGTCFAETHKR